MKGLELTAAPDADVLDVAKAIVKIVDMPFGARPFRVHIDPAQDGAREISKAVVFIRDFLPSARAAHAYAVLRSRH